MKNTTVLLSSFLIAGTMGISAQTPQNQESTQAPSQETHRPSYGHPYHPWPHIAVHPNGDVSMPASTAHPNGDVKVFPPMGSTEMNKAPKSKTFKEIREDQIAFFNKRIGLTPAEAEQFWPIVDDIRAQRWKINRELHQLLRAQNDINFDKTNKRLIELKTRDAELERECYNRLRKVLSPEKLYRYYQTDDAYYRNMLRDFRGGWGR